MRILLTFLMDPDARPTAKDMKLWVDVIRFVKSGARGGALSFFTYMELSACSSSSSQFTSESLVRVVRSHLVLRTQA